MNSNNNRFTTMATASPRRLATIASRTYWCLHHGDVSAYNTLLALTNPEVAGLLPLTRDYGRFKNLCSLAGLSGLVA
jgi:hypothetical protein